MNTHGAEWRTREGYQVCGYCGGLNPYELLSVINLGLLRDPSGSDWKYGFPHKFYLSIESGIPAETYYRIYLREGEAPPEGYVELADSMGSRCYEVATEEEWVKLGHGHSTGTGRIEGTGRIWSKFYTEHILDLKDDPSVLQELCDAIERIWNIRFAMEDGKLKYRAPYHGYQLI